MKKETITSDPRGFFKRDPMEMFGNAPKHKIVTEAQEKASRDSRNAESDLQTRICKWLRKTYPGLLFISDFAAGMKLSLFLAAIRSLQSCDSKMVDLIILRPSLNAYMGPNYHGLCIEIKTSEDKVFMRDGVTLLKNEHTLAQYETIKQLRLLGYAACFGCGEERIKSIIETYMTNWYKQPEYIERDFTQPCEADIDNLIWLK